MVNTLEITAGEQNAIPSVGRKVARFGACSAGVANQVYELSRGQDVGLGATLGYGHLTEETAQGLRLTGQDCVAVPVETDVAGVIGTVTEDPSGTGPLITLTGTPTIDLPELRCKVTKGGAAGSGQVAFALDGATYGATYDIPAESPGAVTGTVDLTTITLLSLNTLTVVAAPDGAADQTVNLTTPADLAGLLTQLNTGTTGMTWSLVGGRYLRCVSDTVGASSSIQIQAASTADVILGLDNTLHSGSASSLPLPGTGLVVGFPATSDYVLNTVYSAAITGPRFSNTALGAAMDAFKAALIKAAVVTVCQDPLDATEAKALVDFLDAKLASWANSDEPIYPVAIVGSPLGDPSAFATNDNVVKAAFNGHNSLYTTVVHGDIYTTGSEIRGSFRRSLRVPAVVRCAGYSLSEDLGNGEFPSLPECSMIHPDGITKARNEKTATVKMRSSRFTVAETRKGAPYFARGVTRAPVGSKFADLGVLRMAYDAADEVWDRMLDKSNITRDLKATGVLRDIDRKELEKFFRNGLEERLIKGVDKHASAVVVEINAAESVSSTRNMTVKWTVQHRAQIATITGKLSVSGTLSLS
jgi:hypothetical protein